MTRVFANTRVLRFAALVLLLLGSRSLCLGQASNRHLLLISIDGMMADDYVHPDRHQLRIPNLRSFAASGCASPGALGVFPTVTYPSHTTMITGVNPARHGILNNTPLDPLDLNFGGWYYFADEIRVPTLWQAAHAAGLKTAAVGWPVTVGAEIDTLVPEYHPVRTEQDISMMRALSTPHLLDDYEARKGKLQSGAMEDDGRLRLAEYVLTSKAPNLFALHIIGLDEVQHEFGPDSPEAHAELERIDARLGELRKQVENLPWGKDADWVIVSDHGFRAVSRQFHPKIVLRNAGLIQVSNAGRVIDWKVFPRIAGGSFTLVAKDPADSESIAKAKDLFARLAEDPANGLGKLYTLGELKDLEASSDAFLAYEARPGFAFGTAQSGNLTTPSSAKGTHGFDPHQPELFTSLILSGPSMKGCHALESARLIDVAPTVAQALGLDLSSAEGRSLLSSAKQK